MKCNVRAAAAASFLSSRASRTSAHGETAPPQGVLGLSANASVEVAKDLIAVTFSTTREGTDANTVQDRASSSQSIAIRSPYRSDGSRRSTTRS